MNKTIKIIDLLNKIANGEEVPKKIKNNSNSYVLNENATAIDNIYRTNNHIGKGWFNKEDFLLNDTVEIIEEQQDIDIQNLHDINIDEVMTLDNDKRIITALANINVLIQAVKQLDKQIKEKE